ncbi:SGNH/GDSL hydrolase family protein [Kribbella turkmenica]|uniref:SGNH/GDSL hydrolase family protein n=1 Tax=Kribbella turkmenica TaxID=2530375 RepID=UPI00140513C2|nr:SGNH/GDSL hydrolase family protein [Kribbella turkmenica]
MALSVVPLGLSVTPASAVESPRVDKTIGTWGAAPVSAAPTEANRVNNQTLRQIVHISTGGEWVRVKLSNRYGSAPLVVEKAHVAVRDVVDQIRAESGGQLTFGGRSSFTIPAFSELYSDWLPFETPDLADLAIDLYVPGDTLASPSPITLHNARPAGQVLSYLAAGNQAGAAEFATAANRTMWYFLTGVDVGVTRAVGGTVVAFGDSITDGSQSTLDANGRWPDYFARRLIGEPSVQPTGVVNMGIGGNRVLTGGTGENALARFGRDALVATGASHVVVLEGINDISGGATAARIIEGHRQLIKWAHNRGLTIYGGTLTAYANAPDAREAERQALNSWIRTSGEYDGVIDFDAALRDPANPRRMLAVYDSGDTLHPNSAGYEAMANAIDLDLFKHSSLTTPTLDESDLQAVATWGAPMVSATPSATNRINNQTLRQIARISNGGDRFRVRLSNRWGTVPLVIESASMALRSSDAQLVAGSGRQLTISGSQRFTLPPGAEVLSDWVDLSAPDLADVAIDLYVPTDTLAASSPLTVRNGALQTTYLSASGDHVGATAFPVASTRLQWNFLAGVDVSRQGPTSTVVAFGDSITEGLRSTANTNRRWPDVLARRLMELPAARQMGVANLGISGNRVWVGGGATNPSALARLDQDVLIRSGATHVIVLLGINDISGGATEQDVIGALRQVITRAHARGLKIYGGTLTPFGNAPDLREERRLAVNEWIRTSGEFDAVVDFDAALRDPANPRRMLPAYDSGDSLHPSDAGYEAMGNAIPLNLFQVAAGSANAWSAVKPAA